MNGQQNAAQYKAALIAAQQQQMAALRAAQGQPQAGTPSAPAGAANGNPAGLQGLQTLLQNNPERLAAFVAAAREGKVSQEHLAQLRALLGANGARPPGSPAPARPPQPQVPAQAQAPATGAGPQNEQALMEQFNRFAQPLRAKVAALEAALRDPNIKPEERERCNNELAAARVQQQNLARQIQLVRESFRSKQQQQQPGVAAAEQPAASPSQSQPQQPTQQQQPQAAQMPMTGASSGGPTPLTSGAYGPNAIPATLNVSASAPEPFPNASGPRPTLTQGLGAAPVLATPALQKPDDTAASWEELLGIAAAREDKDDTFGTADPLALDAGIALAGAASGGEDRLLNKRKIQDLVGEIDGDERLEGDVEDLLLEIADEFIESVTQMGCRLAKHRRGDKLEVRDVQLHLERNWNLRVPFPGSMPIPPPRAKPSATGTKGGGNAAAAN